MRNKFLKATAGIAAFAAIAAVAPLSPTASAAPPFPAEPVPLGTSVAGGTSSTTFALSFPSAQFCEDPLLPGGAPNPDYPGDATKGYRWGTFITPASEVAPETFTASGSPIGSSTATTKELRTTAGIQIRAQNPGLGDGLVVPPIDVSFNNLNFASLAANPGSYNIGIACTRAVDPDGAGPLPAVVTTQRYWTTPIEIAPATGAGAQNFLWGQPAAPTAPAISTPDASAAVPTIEYSVPPTISALSNLTATVTPTAGGSPINVPLASQASPATTGNFTIPGLTLGETYTVTVTATNDQGTSADSDSLTLTPSQTVAGPVVQDAEGFPDADIAVTWSATPNATSYDVVVLDGSNATVFSAPGETGTSVTVPANTLAEGTYTVRVTPNLPAGFDPDPDFGEGTLTVKPNTLLYQQITVERPAGALILTQRCNVYGGLPAYGTNPATTTLPGFPRLLAALGAIGVTTGLAGDAPIVVDSGLPDDALGQFDRYPNPVDPQYPTQCGVQMGTAELVLEGDLAGRFYTAHGQLNQVTILDTTDDDLGWIANGDLAGDFVLPSPTPGNPPTDTFDGNYLGWQPQLTRFTSSPAYPRTITTGPAVAPGQNTADATGGIGMKDSPLLASAPAGQGQGVVDMDARLALLIPATADAGVYTARLDLTVVSGT